MKNQINLCFSVMYPNFPSVKEAKKRRISYPNERENENFSGFMLTFAPSFTDV